MTASSNMLDLPVITDAKDLHEDLPRRIAALLQHHGVVLVRGVLSSREDFHTVTDRLGSFQAHAKGQFELGKFGQRYGLSDDGTTTTVNLGSEEIPLHRERAYTPIPPQIMFFYCEVPPTTPAPTIALDGGSFFQSLPPRLRQWAETHHLLYRCDFELGDDLRALICNGLGVSDIRQAQALLPLVAQRGLTEDTFELDTFTDDRLAYEIRSPIVRQKTMQGGPAFANTLITASEVSLEDGSPRAGSDSWRAIEALARAAQHEHHWETGDMIVIDNNSAMHGRLAHNDVNRRIALRMGRWAPSFDPEGAGVSFAQS